MIKTIKQAVVAAKWRKRIKAHQEWDRRGLGFKEACKRRFI